MQSNVERQVMASVGTIYAVRRLMSATALKLYACLVAGYGLVQLVWVHRIFENWAQVGVQGTGQFLMSALLNAHLPVQLALAVLLVAGISLVRDLARLVATPDRYAL